jgi:hypothetical protein
MRCLICKKECHPHGPPNEDVPSGALICKTYGNYGSTIYDENLIPGGPNEWLKFIICDDCMTANSDDVVRVHITKRSRVETEEITFTEYLKRDDT